MSEVKKIATRESYGKALVELGGEHSNLRRAGRRSGGRYEAGGDGHVPQTARPFRIAILTAALPRRT